MSTTTTPANRRASPVLPARSGANKPGPQEDLARLHQLVGTAVLGVERAGSSVLSVRLPGWNVAIADVAAIASSSLTEMAAGACRLVGAGRYGRFWWLSFTNDHAPHPAVLLGTRVQLAPGRDGQGIDVDRTRVESGYSPA